MEEIKKAENVINFSKLSKELGFSSFFIRKNNYQKNADALSIVKHTADGFNNLQTNKNK